MLLGLDLEPSCLQTCIPELRLNTGMKHNVITNLTIIWVNGIMDDWDE